MVIHTYDLKSNVGISRIGNYVHFTITQSTSQMNTALSDLYSISIKTGYRPKFAKTAPCIMFNTGDNKFYTGILRIGENGKFSASAILSGGGLQEIASGSTYYIWAVNLMWITYDAMPVD